MTALQTPADDAPAAEWGALAIRIPGWRWPPVACHSTQMRDLWLEVASPIGDSPSPRHVSVATAPSGILIEPDHWAWEGWLLRLLGDTLTRVDDGGRAWVSVSARPDLEGCGITLGRACIAAAAALGRWPGGEG